ncbi:site-specific DNA-methyltransferase [Limosilactobacillus reuteri]|uniref:Methyltransferase n=1 Tax=Limosilactobacillus reuteri TaxID=1598 RepID=A0A317GLU1_LIMRT|nr:site-specific DNA-methyltransferase [Limosilactobacillus reuteri]MCH5384224.1 site-specific DNA-methyltransferase [Limosilactobacillus reuteri]MDC6076603.1 site-specific DNA-methyltransferase [Limosilactobacillus reuteri]PWT49646.1 site-specific DNA-methyltransferase [Limosilactobacillus reuteri]PWT54468.1 site-specific DNA-methyltransferase [Limosilactobacillus reuteri]PWT65114.1 site-specific DNA-methyltransferase [Limosilactobacillus reuteri]
MEWNKIYCSNSDLELPKLVSDGIKFDLILTDPPYNLHKDFGNSSDSLPIDDFLRINKKRIDCTAKLLEKNGSLIWFGIHNYIGFMQVMMYDAGLYYRRMNIWHYLNGFSRTKRMPTATYEPFLWFSKSNKTWTYNADDVRVPYKSTKRLKNPVYYKDKNGKKKVWKPNPNGALRGDIWEVPTLAGKAFEKERTSHPSQKPKELIKEIIKAYMPKNRDGKYEGTLFDPFMGSGTTAVAAEELNREGNNIKWIGFEIEQKWIDIANHRLEEVYKDITLF